jgi:hypothetical protein
MPNFELWHSSQMSNMSFVSVLLLSSLKFI